jgi:lysozyme family protein
MSRFDECLAFTLKWEGGFSDDPLDPGGATYKGITLASYTSWVNRIIPPTVDELKSLTDEQVSDFYLEEFWDVMSCIAYPAGVDLLVFDFGVNTHPGRSVGMLQSVIGAKVDGIAGAHTFAAVRACPVVGLVTNLADAQIEYYKSKAGSPLFKEDGRGWLNRAQARKEAALASIVGAN